MQIAALPDAVAVPPVSPPDTTPSDFNLKMYETANAQFVMRVRQRDSVLLFFVAAVGTIFGLTTEQGALGTEFLLAIPYIGCVCGVMMAYHSLFIEALMKYIQQDVATQLGPERRIFENSAMFSSIGMRGVMLRSIAYVLLLILPMGFALWQTFDSVSRPLWTADLVMAAIGVFSVLYADAMHVINVRRRVRRLQLVA